MGCLVMTSISMQANGNGIHTIAVGCPTNNGPTYSASSSSSSSAAAAADVAREIADYGSLWIDALGGISYLDSRNSS